MTAYHRGMITGALLMLLIVGFAFAIGWLNGVLAT